MISEQGFTILDLRKAGTHLLLDFFLNHGNPLILRIMVQTFFLKTFQNTCILKINTYLCEDFQKHSLTLNI